MQNISNELLEFRKSMRFNQTEIAKMVGVSQRTWSNYEMGIRTPTIKVMIALEKIGFKPFQTGFEMAAEEAGLSIEEAGNRIDLAKGLPPDTPLEEAGKIVRQFQNNEYTIFKYNKPTPQSVPAVKTDSASLVLLPFYSQRASAGPGDEPTQLGNIDSYIPIVINLLRGASPVHCGIVEVKGDSMTDVGLYEGDLAIFNTEKTEGDGIYVITINGLTRIKRLENRPIEKKIIISSENAKRYPTPEMLTYEQAAEMLIIHGKVIGWMHRHFY